MVVAFDNAEKNAKLSLRQSEILEKLSNICSDLSDETDDRQAVPPPCLAVVPLNVFLSVSSSRRFTQNMDVICLSPPRVVHTRDAYRTCYLSRAICVIGTL